MKSIFVWVGALAMAGSAIAKLPAPSDEAKAKAAEATAKTAHAGKVDAFQLCKAQDKVATRTNKATKPAASACVDPGPFVYTPASPAAPAASATSAAVAAVVVAPAAVADKPKK